MLLYPKKDKQNNEFVQEYLYIEEYLPEDYPQEHTQTTEPKPERGIIIIEFFE